MDPGDDVHHPKRTGPPLETAAKWSRLWSTAAERAFATALDRPDAYQRTARLVAAIVEHLRAQGRGVGPLVAAWADHDEVVDRALAADARLSAVGLDAETVAGAAFAMRYREALEEEAADRRLAALTQAPQGSGWIVVEEAGVYAGDPFVAYRRVEVDTGSGRALLVTTRPDETLADCVHGVDEVVIDRTTGHLHEGDGPDPVTREFDSAAAREACVAELKAAATDP